ncbi:MAG: HAMP domain-containing sensor histidine kinase [Lachnospiraceae bacterium]|nr:HAMP domain-containing histidine kinase [Robinsoniella sp.]MDY3766965.1 HAMP domain-containing sensor histidine kinase [Lachnospiraceae bacterium]
MKLRTRMIVISGIAILIALTLTNGIIWIVTNKSQRNEAYIQAFQNSYMVMKDFDKILEQCDKGSLDNSLLQYYFKTYKTDGNQFDDYNICIRQISSEDSSEQYEEIYNHTVFSVDELMNLDYIGCSGSVEMGYHLMDYGGGQYLIFYMPYENNVRMLRIEDISYVQDYMENLAIVMVILTCIVTAVTILILYIALKHVLRPLQELNDTTRQIADGIYDKRVQIDTKDEIGQLAENFNRMAEAVEARTHSLEESEKRKTLFMGNLTHELKTPMTAISGYAQTLLSIKLSPEDQDDALLYIYEECKRLERLSKKMMKLLELDQDAELNLVEIPVKHLFEAAEKSCQVLLKEKQMTLECTEHGEIFRMDFDLMTDVMINLIDNGIKASNPGGRICLHAHDNCIEVQDFGRGIPFDEQDKILEPFYMIDKSRSRKSGGAGLGLALTALIAKRHHIDIQIQSEEGKGTRFILQFVYNSMNT